LSIFHVDELFIFVSELSPPVSESGINIETSCNKISLSTVAIDLENLVTCSDKGFSLAIECELLVGLAVSGLDQNVA
jgi:hypothetical protein